MGIRRTTPRRTTDKPGRFYGAEFARGGAAGSWIKDAVKRPGALHRALDVPEGDKIPAKKLDRAEHSGSPRLRREASLAKTLKGFHHKD